jgi:hypothetical protein
MTAILRTRCGCTRDITVPAPAPPTIKMPLAGQLLFLYQGDPVRPSFQELRTFERQGHTAVYLETSER